MSNDDQKPPVKPPFTQAPPPGQGQPYVQEPTGLSAMIPDKNTPALISYYLGLFAIMPCFGLAFGPIAFVKGRQALADEKANPQIKGGTHAKVGIGCGAIGFIFNLLIVALAIAIALSSKKS